MSRITVYEEVSVSGLGELRSLAVNARRNAQGGRRVKERMPDNRAAFLFLLPWIIGLVIFSIGPIIASLYLSFTDYNLLKSPLKDPPAFTGFENYGRMFTDPAFWNSFRVTVEYVFVSVPLLLVLALALAMLLDRGMRGLGFYRSVFYLPSLLGGSVAVAILWRQVFGKEGIFNGFLAIFGIDGPGWIGHPDFALGTIMVLHIWTFGSPMIIFLAGLRQIPDMYHEAASVDGAGKVRRFFSVTLPLLTPIIFFNLVLQMIFAFQTFTQAYVVSGGTGGPADSTMFYTLFLYRIGFLQYDMGYASAMAWFLLIVIAAFTAFNFWLSKFWVFYDD